MNNKNKVRIWPSRHHDAKPDHFHRYDFASRVFRKGTSIVDAACGVGYGSSILHHGGHEVIGYDISSDAIEHAKHHFQTSAGPQFVCADITSIPKTKADVLVTFETIEHLEAPLNFLNNFDVEYIVASVPNQNFYPFKAEVFKDDEYPHLRHYTPEEFDELFRMIGFKVVARYCQKNKQPGNVEDGVDGLFIIYIAQKSVR